MIIFLFFLQNYCNWENEPVRIIVNKEKKDLINLKKGAQWTK